MPHVTCPSSIHDRDTVANSAVRFTRINDPEATKNDEPISVAAYVDIAESRHIRRGRLQAWRIPRGAEDSASFILHAKGSVSAKLYAPHVEHHIVGFIFFILNRTHQRLSSGEERRIEGFQLHVPLVDRDRADQG